MNRILLAGILLLGASPLAFAGDGDAPGAQSLEQRLERIEQRIEDLFQLVLKMSEPEGASSARALDFVEIARLRRELAEIRRENEGLRKRIEELERKAGALPKTPSALPPGEEPINRPTIEGSVVGVSSRANLVVIDRGEESGVRVDDAFYVWRGDVFIGKLLIEKVYPRQSAGRMQTGTVGQAPAAGDCVSSTNRPLPGREQLEAAPMPDGKITRADTDQGYAYIDIGSKDGVRQGMRFKVYTVLRGGLRQEKGEIRVLRLEKDFCQCTILAMPDDANPIVMGDYVWNRLFVKGRRLNFAFVGQFGGERVHYTKEDLTRMIQEAGHSVSDTVRPDTDFVVIGEEVGMDPQYRLVQGWRVEKVKPKDLFDFFGFGLYARKDEGK